MGKGQGHVRDIWRSLNPEKRQFSFRRGPCSSRLDYWLISEHLTELASDSSILPVALSDHSMVSLSVMVSPELRGPGLWRFDNRLLKDLSFCSALTTHLQNFLADSGVSSPHVRWDFLKYEIRKFSIDYTRKAKHSLKGQIASLKKELMTIEERNPASSKEEEIFYHSKKRELAELELHLANRTIFKARANWSQLGERPTKFFLSLEKSKARANVLSQALDSNGSLTSDPKKILELTRDFYEQL